MRHTTLQKLAIASVQTLLKQKPFFYKLNHQTALRAYETELLTRTLTNAEIIQKTEALKRYIYEHGWLGIPGFGCNYYLKPINCLLNAGHSFQQDRSELSLKTNAIRRLALLATNDLGARRTPFTRKSKQTGLVSLVDVVYAPKSSDEQIIAVFNKVLTDVSAEKRFARLRKSYFLDRLNVFLAQAKAIYKKPGTRSQDPGDFHPDRTSTTFLNLHQAYQTEMSAKKLTAEEAHFKEMDSERLKLEDDISQLLAKHAYNSPLAAKWVFRLNRVSNGEWPVTNNLFFTNNRADILHFDKMYPHLKLATLIADYAAIISNKDYDSYLRGKLIKRDQESLPMASWKRSTPTGVGVPRKKTTLFGGKISVSGLAEKEDRGKDYIFGAGKRHA